MKTLAHFLSLLIPVKKVRKKLRYNLYRKDKINKRKLSILRKFDGYKHEHVSGVDIAHINKYRLANIFDGDDVNIISEIFYKGEYGFSLGSDVVVIDIGMNVGMASLYFASLDNVKHVYGYEPFKPTYEKALLNISLNEDLAHKITAYNVGLGKYDRELVVGYDKNAPGMMSTVNKENDNEITDVVLEKVNIVDAAIEVDRITNSHAGVNIVIKCDTEGAENEIFESLDRGGLFAKIDMIMMEYHFSSDKQICAFLAKNHFAYFKQKFITLETGDFGMIRAVKL